jgi:hypothetical protein
MVMAFEEAVDNMKQWIFRKYGDQKALLMETLPAGTGARGE